MHIPLKNFWLRFFASTLNIDWAVIHCFNFLSVICTYLINLSFFWTGLVLCLVFDCNKNIYLNISICTAYMPTQIHCINILRNTLGERQGVGSNIIFWLSTEIDNSLVLLRNLIKTNQINLMGYLPSKLTFLWSIAQKASQLWYKNCTGMCCQVFRGDSSLHFYSSNYIIQNVTGLPICSVSISCWHVSVKRWQPETAAMKLIKITSSRMKGFVPIEYFFTFCSFPPPVLAQRLFQLWGM